MDDQEATTGGPIDEQPQGLPARTASGRSSRALRAAGLVAAGVLAGGTLAGTMSAVAADTPTPSPTPSASSGASGSAEAPNGAPAPGGPGCARSDETPLTGSDLEKATAAALKAVPGGTVVRAETDSGDAVYEVHMTKTDGTPVTVTLDKNFVVTGTKDGMGKGGPGMGGPKGPRPDGQAPPSGQTPPTGQATPTPQSETSSYSSSA